MANEWWKSPELASIYDPVGEVAAQQQPMPAQTMPMPSKDGYTGAGADGVVQPSMRVPGVGNENADKHEAEYVLNANATQNVGVDVLDAFQKEAESGNLDLNKIRSALGLDPKQGYQSGGLTMPVQPNGGGERTGTAAPARQPSGKPPQPKPTSPTPGGDDWYKFWSKKKITGDITGPDQQNLDPINPNTIIDPIVGPDQQGLPNIDPNNIVGPDQQNLPNINPDLPIIDQNIIGPQEKIIQDIDPGKEGMKIDGGKIKPLPKPPPDLTEQEKQDWIPKPPDPDTVPTDEEITSDDIMDYLNGIMDGSHPYFQTIKDLVAQDLGGTGAATTAALKQQGAMAGMSADQIASMGMTRARDIESTTSQALGKLAAGQMEMGMQAAKDLWGMNMEQQQLDWAKEKYGDQQGMDIAKLIQNGASFDHIKRLYPDMTLEDYNSMKDFSPMGWQQESFKQQMDFAIEKYGDEKGKDIAKLVNDGWTLEMLQEKYPDMNITEEDFKQMQDWSPTQTQKDQWEYQKKVDSFNQLLQQGGADNLGAAADLFNDMFGTDIDFSNALTEENLDKFNASYNSLASDVASGKSFEDWMKTAKADGTFDDLNMTESDIKTMYQNMQLQSNPIWQSSEQLKLMVEKGLMTEEQYEDTMAILMKGIQGGITVSDAYQVLDKNGDEVGNFKTQQEADDFIADNPDAEYTSNVLENSWFDFGDDDDPDPDDPEVISDADWEAMDDTKKNEHFLENIPSQFLEEWDTEDGYTKWVNAGMPQSWSAYQDYLDQNTGDFTKTQQEKYDKDGWGQTLPDTNIKKDEIVAAREKFLAGGEGIVSMGQTDWKDFRWDSFVTDSRFTSGNVVSIEGQNPMVITSDLTQMGPEANFIVAYDLVTGEKILIGRVAGGGLKVGGQPSDYTEG